MYLEQGACGWKGTREVKKWGPERERAPAVLEGPLPEWQTYRWYRTIITFRTLFAFPLLTRLLSDNSRAAALTRRGHFSFSTFYRCVDLAIWILLWVDLVALGNFCRQSSNIEFLRHKERLVSICEEGILAEQRIISQHFAFVQFSVIVFPDNIISHSEDLTGRSFNLSGKNQNQKNEKTDDDCKSLFT